MKFAQALSHLPRTRLEPNSEHLPRSGSIPYRNSGRWQEPPRGTHRAMLRVNEVSKDFGGVRAVDRVSFSLALDRITGLIGPNGAGKTTLFNLIAGSLRPSAGSVAFEGERIDGRPPHAVFAAGIARTFQIPRPFSAMTVLDDLMVAPHRQSGERFWNNWLEPRRIVAEE